MAPRAPAAPDRPPHALVADDDVDRLAELTYRVARLGLTVSSAADRAEAWSAMHERPPDVAVLAASLALAQGGDLLRRLARVRRAARTPFVLVAAEDDAPSGPRVYPSGWEELEATVRRALRERTARAAGQPVRARSPRSR